MTFEIVQAKPEHIDAVYTMVREFAREIGLLGHVSGTQEDLHAALFAPHPKVECSIALIEGAAQGFAIYFQAYSTFLARPGIYLEDLYVRPAFRSAGIGGALFRSIAALAVARGCARFEWSILDGARSIKFYEQMGATLMTRTRVMRLTGDALTLASTLRDNK